MRFYEIRCSAGDFGTGAGADFAMYMRVFAERQSCRVILKLERKADIFMNQLNLLEDKISTLFLKYLVPSISATFVTSIYILADTIMIGRGVGAVGIAALNLLLPLFNLFFGTGILFGVGGSVLFSIAKGRKDETGARQYFSAAALGAFLMSVFYLVAFHVFFDAVTAFLGRTESVGALVDEYGRILVTGAPVFVFSSFLQAFVRNDRAPKRAMAAVISGGVANVILDYVFIFPMGMGMTGAVVATVIGTVITIIILCSHFFSKENTLKLVKTFSLKMTGQVAVNGLSSFLVEVSGGIVILLFNIQLLRYVGDLGVVVYGIVSNSALIVSSVSNGISQASQPLMAVNFGAGLKDRVVQTRKMGEKAAVISGILFASVGIFCPEMMVYMFVEPTPEIIQMAVPAVRIYFLSFLGTGFNILMGTYFQSVLKPGLALSVSLLRGLVINGLLVMALPAIFGVNGIWMTMTVTEAAVLLGCLYIVNKQK